MKHLHVPFTDEEYELLKWKKTEDRNWHDFIIELSELQIYVKCPQ